MDNSKLIDLLRTFSTKELREMGEFIHSPFFNKNEELARFYDQLRKLAPNFPEKKLKREYVFKQLYPRQPYDDKQLNYLMSFTLKLAEQYIGYTHFKQSDVLEKVHIMSSYDERNLEKHYQFILNQVGKSLDELPYRDIEFYHQQYLLADISNRHFLKQKIRKYDDRLQVAADYLDQFYLARKLRYCCEMLDRRKSIAADYQLKFVEELKAYIAKHQEMRTPAVEVYYTVLNMLETQEQQYFAQLKGLLAKYSKLFPVDDLKDIYSYAINYSIRQVNQGNQQYLEELFELYKDTLRQEILFENDRLSPWAYKNIIGVGLRLRQFDWTENFIREYNERLAPEFQDNALHYNLAELYYYRKDFDQALSHLNRVEFSDIYYSLDTKKMMLKIYYEQEEIDALYSLMASFKMYLKRTKLISPNNRTAYQNFVQVLGQLIKRDPKQYKEIEEQLNNPAPLGDRKWLKDMFGQLSGKAKA